MCASRTLYIIRLMYCIIFVNFKKKILHIDDSRGLKLYICTMFNLNIYDYEIKSLYVD